MHNDRKRRSDIVNNDKGRTIRKLMRGGGGGKGAMYKKK